MTAKWKGGSCYGRRVIDIWFQGKLIRIGDFRPQTRRGLYYFLVIFFYSYSFRDTQSQWVLVEKRWVGACAVIKRWFYLDQNKRHTLKIGCDIHFLPDIFVNIMYTQLGQAPARKSIGPASGLDLNKFSCLWDSSRGTCITMKACMWQYFLAKSARCPLWQMIRPVMRHVWLIWLLSRLSPEQWWQGYRLLFFSFHA